MGCGNRLAIFIGTEFRHRLSASPLNVVGADCGFTAAGSVKAGNTG